MSSSDSRRTKIFVSYSHKDSDWIEPFRDHLALFGPDTVWIDKSSIDYGSRWEQEIEAGLASARVAVLMISASFLSSKFIKEKELPYLLTAAEKEELTLLPIYLRHCVTPREIAELQAINEPENPLAAFKDEPAKQDGVWVRTIEKIRETLSKLILVTAASEDREAVEQVLGKLEEAGLRFDLEIYRNAADREIHERVLAKLSQRQAALIFFGARGLGLWEQETLRQGLRSEFEKSLDRAGRSWRLLSAILPEAPEDLRLPAFLPNNTRIRFPRGLADATTLRGIEAGLTGEWRPVSPPAPPQGDGAPQPGAPAPEHDPVDSEVDVLVRGLATQNLTIFLGDEVVPAGESEPSERQPLRAWQLARKLLDQLEDDKGLERPPLSLDIAGAYFAACKSERSLDLSVRGFVSEDTEPTATHEQIARLLRTLHELERGDRFARRGQSPVRLIVTTNINLLMERALLRARVPFVRLVQSELGEKIVVNEYRELTSPAEKQLIVRTGEEKIPLRLDDDETLCQVIADFGRRDFVYRASGAAATEDTYRNPLRSLPLEEFEPKVVLYKFHGSEDVERSCAISIDQHFRLIRTVLEKDVIPLKVTEYLSGGPVLLFGFGLLDSPFRVLLHTLPLANAAAIDFDGGRYLLLLPPAEDDPDDFRRFEQRLWPKIKGQAEKLGIAVLEKPGDRFLAELTDGLEAHWGREDAGHA